MTGKFWGLEEAPPPAQEATERPRRNTIERFNDELSVLERPLEGDVEYYDEAPPPARLRKAVAFVMAAGLTAAGSLFIMRHVPGREAVAQPSPAPAAIAAPIAEPAVAAPIVEPAVAPPAVAPPSLPSSSDRAAPPALAAADPAMAAPPELAADREAPAAKEAPAADDAPAARQTASAKPTHSSRHSRHSKPDGRHHGHHQHH
jgi:hypothetical protein